MGKKIEKFAFICENRCELALNFFHRQICGYLVVVHCAEVVEFVHACIGMGSKQMAAIVTR